MSTLPYTAYSFGGTTMTLLVSGEQTEGRFSILHARKPSGSSTPLHRHESDAELPLVLSGALGVQTDKGVTLLKPGEFMYLPPGPPHRVFNESGGMTTEFLLCIPAGFERYVQAAGETTTPFADPAPMTDSGRERLVALAPQFGIQILPPAPSAGPSSRPHDAHTEKMVVLGRRVEILKRFGEAEDCLVLLRATLRAGDIVPLCAHEDPIAFFVAAGAMEWHSEGALGNRTALAEGMAAYAAPGTRHILKCSASEPVTLLLVASTRFVAMCRALSFPIGEFACC